MNPSETLGLHLRAEVLSGVTVYDAPANQITAPAVVIRPDQPWITPQDDGTWCYEHERYVAIVVTKAASPRDAVRLMRSISLSIIRGLPEGWRFDTLSAPVLDESTGSAFLAASIRLSYFNTEEEES